MRKRISKRRVLARLALGRDVDFADLMLRDLDHIPTPPRFFIDFHRERVRKLGRFEQERERVREQA